MNCRRYSLIAGIFIVFAAFFSSKNANAAENAFKIHSNIADHLKSGQTSSWFTISSGESVQLIAPQQHKTVHYVKTTFTAPVKFVVCIRCYNFFTGTGKYKHADFQKLLLFPFHVFW